MAGQRYLKHNFKRFEDIMDNKMDNYNGNNDDLFYISRLLSNNNDLIGNMAKYCKNDIIYLYNKYNDKYLRDNDRLKTTIYTGLNGISILFLRIILLIDKYNDTNNNDNNNNNNDNDVKRSDTDTECLWKKFIESLCVGLNVKDSMTLREKLVKRIVSFVKYKGRARKGITLVCGDIGVLTVACIVYIISNNKNKYEKYLKYIVDLSKNIVNDYPNENEFLYGKIGYISCILFIQSFLSNKMYSKSNINLFDIKSIQNIMDAIINEGLYYAKMQQYNDIPLLYIWHNKEYLSGAHGLVGIIHILLQIKYSKNKYSKLFDKTISYLLTTKLQNGNYPTKYNNNRDYFFQFCHGLTSYLMLFIRYYNINSNDKLLKQILLGNDVLFKYGLLLKSKCICHGITGNAYPFLYTYSMLKKHNKRKESLKYLYYALQFGIYSSSKNVKLTRKPDNPDSLYEGKSGELCFYLDLLFNNDNPKFPCYDFV